MSQETALGSTVVPEAERGGRKYPSAEGSQDSSSEEEMLGQRVVTIVNGVCTPMLASWSIICILSGLLCYVLELLLLTALL